MRAWHDDYPDIVVTRNSGRSQTVNVDDALAELAGRIAAVRHSAAMAAVNAQRHAQAEPDVAVTHSAFGRLGETARTASVDEYPVLSRSEFGDAVRAAMRDLRSGSLSGSVLVHSRIVASIQGTDGTRALGQLLRDAIRSMLVDRQLLRAAARRGHRHVLDLAAGVHRGRGLALGDVAITVVAARDSRSPAGRSLDPAGQATVGLGLCALLWGVIQGAADGWGAPTVVGAFALAAVCLVAFVVIKLRAQNPSGAAYCYP